MLAQRTRETKLAPAASSAGFGVGYPISLLIKQLRVRQWVKNGLIFFPLIFSNNLDSPDRIVKAIICFVFFSFLASSVYMLNDLIDLDRDRLHPKKQTRPIACGQFPVWLAWAVFILLLGISLGGAYIQLGVTSFLLFVGYYLANILYSVFLKTVPPLDIIMVAGFFLLRPIVGAAAIEVPASNWMIITTFFASLYLVVLKRSAELQSIQGGQAVTRKNIERYSLPLLQQLGLVSVTAAIVSYAIYASSFSDYFEFTTIPLVGLAFRVMMLQDQRPAQFEGPRPILADPVALFFSFMWFVVIMAYHWG